MKIAVEDFVNYIKSTPDGTSWCYANNSNCPFAKFIKHKTHRKVCVSPHTFAVTRGQKTNSYRIPMVIAKCLLKATNDNGIITKENLLKELDKNTQ